MQGIIIENIANLYRVKPIYPIEEKDTVKSEDKRTHKYLENKGEEEKNCQKGWFSVAIYEATARGKFKKDEITPVVGDWIEFEVTDEKSKKAVITSIGERKVYVKRPRLANITQMIFVVSSQNPKPDLLMLDKQLAFAEFMGIKALIVLNKIDLDNKQEFKEIKKIYEKIGYKIIETEAKSQKGMDRLRQELKNNVNAFSGNSGVGKSTLVNGIFKQNITLEGEISQRNKRGKNTTTSIKLYQIDDNTYLADTPRIFYFFNRGNRE